MVRRSSRRLMIEDCCYEAELGFDGLRLRSSDGIELHYPSDWVMSGTELLESLGRSGGLSWTPIDIVSREDFRDWVRSHGMAVVLDYFFGGGTDSDEQATREAERAEA